MLNEYDFSKAERVNMNTTNKVQVGQTTTGTSTSTTSSQWQTYNNYKAEQGWECPRCGRINAPWVRQCDCSRNNWTVTWTSDRPSWTGDSPEWWKGVTCDGCGDNCPDNVLNNSVTYKTDIPTTFTCTRME